MTTARKSALISLCLFCLPFVHCGKKTDPGFFRTYFQSDPGKIDPFYSTDVVSGKVLAGMCDGLLRISADGKVTADLCSSWNFDGITFTGELKENARFSDGTQTAASDVRYSLLRIRDSEKPTSPRKANYACIKDMTIESPRRFTITLKTRNMAFLYLLTQVNSYIISEKAMREKNTVIGTGVFALKEWRKDEEIILVRNPYYHGQPAQIEGISFRIIPEDLTARFEFQSGTLDYFELPYLSSAVFDSAAFKTEVVPELCVHYLALNTQRAPFDNPLFRKALNMAIDRKAIVKALFKDRFTPAAGPVPPGTGSYQGNIAPIGYDPDAARAIIEKLGLKGRTFSLNCKAEHQVSLTAQMIQTYLEAAGITVEIHEMEWASLKSLTNAGRYDIGLFNWYADYPDAENFLKPLFHSSNKGSGGNRAFYDDPLTDRLIDRASGTVDENERNRLYQQAEQRITDNAPWVFLWYGGRRLAFSKRIDRFTAYPVYNGMKGNEIIIK